MDVSMTTEMLKAQTGGAVNILIAWTMAFTEWNPERDGRGVLCDHLIQLLHGAWPVPKALALERFPILAGFLDTGSEELDTFLGIGVVIQVCVVDIRPGDLLHRNCGLRINLHPSEQH